jgi:hypothetical protein
VSESSRSARKVLPFLKVVYEEREAESDFVITRYRQANANLRTQFIRYIRKAGATPWPRLFHNLRASCQTELAERFPSHVICKWIGNTDLVARRHYLQPNEDHFLKATTASGVQQIPSVESPKSDAESDAAISGKGPQELAPEESLMQKLREILKVAKECDPARIEKWAVQGSNL